MGGGRGCILRGEKKEYRNKAINRRRHLTLLRSSVSGKLLKCQLHSKHPSFPFVKQKKDKKGTGASAGILSAEAILFPLIEPLNEWVSAISVQRRNIIEQKTSPLFVVIVLICKSLDQSVFTLTFCSLLFCSFVYVHCFCVFFSTPNFLRTPGILFCKSKVSRTTKAGSALDSLDLFALSITHTFAKIPPLLTHSSKDVLRLG